MPSALSTIGSDTINDISSAHREPSWLREHRSNSLAIYEDLPIETSPLYTKYTDAERMDPAQVMISPHSDSVIPAVLKKRLEELQGKPHLIQVGTNIIVNIPDELLVKGLVITPLEDALREDGTIPRGIMESSDLQEDRFTALNNAAFNSGFFIHIPRMLEIETPIHVVTSLATDGTSTISQNIISAGEGSRSSVVQELYSPYSEGQQAYMELLNARVANGAQMDITTLQVMDQSSVNFSTRRTDIGQDAGVNWYLGLFGGMLSRYRIDYHLNGSGARTNDSEVIFGSREQSFDIQSNINHHAPATEGRVNEKSILRNRSKSLFKGMIRIMENASKSSSFLSGRSILLDHDAKSEAIPGLEILTNDVKATHSASVAQIDEEQIFYLQTRCLSKEESERTIVEGFLEPMSRKMSYQIRAWIAYLIESKWEGRDLRINTDQELAKFIEVEETRYNEDTEIEQHYKYR